MANRVVIRENVAEPGSTQINNINFTTSTLQPYLTGVNNTRLIDEHSAHRR